MLFCKSKAESLRMSEAAMDEIIILMAQLCKANPDAYCDACRMCLYCRQGRFCCGGVQNEPCRSAVRLLLKSKAKGFPHAEVNQSDIPTGSEKPNN